MRTARGLVSTRDGRRGVLLLGALVALCFLVGPVALADPNTSDFSVHPALDGGPARPSLRHWLGVDALYRDELSRLAAGGRASLAIGLGATALATFLGLLVGVGAATASKIGARWADALLMRVVDVLLAFPLLLLVTLVGVLVGRTDALTMVAVLGATGWLGIARVIRARAAQVLEEDFVMGARAMGASATRIALRHVIPNVAPTAIALAASLTGSMILAEAVLGYLGVGLGPPTASWGRMLHESESFFVLRPSLVALPAAFILVTVLAFHRIGEGMRLSADPRARAAAEGRVPLDLVAVFVGLAAIVLAPRDELPSPRAIASTPAPTRGGTLRLATMYSARTLDPALSADEIGVAVDRMVFGRLVALDEAGDVVPELARRTTWRDEGKTLEIELVSGASFQDGAPFTAADVKRSFERAFAPSVPSPVASHFASIVGLDAYRQKKASGIEGIEVVGPETVRLHLTEPNATLPSLLSMTAVSPVCPSTPFDVAKTTDAELCGAGPFRIAKFDGGEGVSLVRNERYFQPELPYLDEVRILFLVRPQVQRYRFERGELDLVRELASSDAALFRGDVRYAPLVHLVKNLRVSAIFMNTERPPFDDVHLRRAVSFAVDPRVLERLRPDLRAIETVVPPGVPGRPAAAAGRVHDVDAALAEMAAAGYPFDPARGTGGYPHEIEYLTIPDSIEQAAAEIYQQQLAKVGIRIKLVLVSSLSYLAIAQSRGRATMGWAGWQADYPDPLTFFDPNLVTASLGDVSQNYAFFSNAEVDELVERARRSTDPVERAELFAKAESVVAREAPWVPTTSPATFEVHQPWLYGYAPTALTQLDFTRTFIAHAEAP